MFYDEEAFVFSSLLFYRMENETELQRKEHSLQKQRLHSVQETRSGTSVINNHQSRQWVVVSCILSMCI